MERDNLKSYENLCKIFEMRIKLDKEKNETTDKEVLENYEKYTKKIDSINNLEFQAKVKPLVKPESTLEKEKVRLEKLVELLKERLEKREYLEDKYYSTTGRYMRNIQPIVSENELNDKEDRLALINKYLNNTNEIESITEDIAKLKNDLEEEENKKSEFLSKNSIMEKALTNSFLNIVKEDSYYNNISDEKDIDNELSRVFEEASEAYETLNVTKDSIDSLVAAGINDEYFSYIDEASKNYYVWKNREYILKIYELILKNKSEFLDLYNKLNDIKDLIDARKKLRVETNVETIDEFSSFESKLLEQLDILNKEKEVLDNISNFTTKIKFKEEKLNEIEEDNNSVEMLSLLKEFGIIDVYSSEDKTEEIKSLDASDGSLEDVVNEVIDPYRIIDVSSAPLTLNVGLAKLKGESVREKVNKKLNPEIRKELSDDEERSVEVNNVFPLPVWDVNTSLEEKESEEILPLENEMLKENNAESNNVVNEPLPIWNIPVNEANNDFKENIPMWNTNVSTASENVNFPIREAVPEVDIAKEDNNIEVTGSKNIDNNQFWVPINGEKLESDVMPNLNTQANITYNNIPNNFGFPEINGGDHNAN